MWVISDSIFSETFLDSAQHCLDMDSSIDAHAQHLDHVRVKAIPVSFKGDTERVRTEWERTLALKFNNHEDFTKVAVVTVVANSGLGANEQLGDKNYKEDGAYH